MSAEPIRILLADDDKEDCAYFSEALQEISFNTMLTTVHDGVDLLRLLNSAKPVNFDVLFLDLNMPRKNGFLSLEEIKSSPDLRSLPVIILSTSYDEHSADLLYGNQAQFYIRKPTEFETLKKNIHQILELVIKKNSTQPPRDEFLLKVN